MSNLYIQIKYARMVGTYIDRWVVKKDNPFHGNGRCPVCGDSAKNKAKTRFHLIQQGDSIFAKCFNCDYSTNLIGFMKTYHPGLYSEFIFEAFRGNNDNDAPIITCESKIEPEPIKTVCNEKFLLDLPYIKDLEKNDPARVYVDSRRIPDYPFQYAENFYKFSSQFNEDLSEYTRDEPRLIIPFFDKKGSVFAYQGRDLSGKSNQKYITIIVNRKVPKIFGIDRVDLKKPVTVVEGPIDSLFLNNCLASVNASLVSTAKKIECAINRSLITLVYDNEPRNKTIVNMYSDAIKQGYKIVIWPQACDGIKDINEMSLKGKNPQKIIDTNTYQGIRAQLEFQKWKKI